MRVWGACDPMMPPSRLETIHWLGVCAICVVGLLVFGTLITVFWSSETPAQLGAADWAAIRFTVMQALLSAGVSCVLAIPMARALARRNFWGRSLLVTLLGAPFILPVIVAILGLLAVFGRSGLVSQTLGLFGFEPVSIYGFHGVVIAHVFLNLPLATRLILQGWLSVPAERFRLAASLGFAPSDVARILERPILRATLPGAFAVIFLICLTSFAVALTLGGGPKATTIELAIFQAFTFDFDLGRAALLATTQLGLTLIAAFFAYRFTTPSVIGTGLDRAVERWDADQARLKVQDAVLLTLSSAFLLVPLVTLVVRGAPELLTLPPSVWRATFRSIAVALGSATVTLVFALPIALLTQRLAPKPAKFVEAAGYLTVAASSLVLGTGLFIVLYPFVDPITLALPVTALVNAILSLPFALRALLPAIREAEAGYGRLADSLAITGFARLRVLIIPRIRRSLGFASGIAAAFSMGDLGVIALFANTENATLPLQLYRLMGSYQMDSAMGAALLLMATSLALFWIFDRGGRLAQA